MQQPNGINLDEWQVYADYCFDYKPQEEQRARNIIKAIQNNKIKLFLCFKRARNIITLSYLNWNSNDEHSLSPANKYFWQQSLRNISLKKHALPFCPFNNLFIFKDFEYIITKYFDKLNEIGNATTK